MTILKGHFLHCFHPAPSARCWSRWWMTDGRDDDDVIFLYLVDLMFYHCFTMSLHTVLKKSFVVCFVLTEMLTIHCQCTFAVFYIATEVSRILSASAFVFTLHCTITLVCAACLFDVLVCSGIRCEVYGDKCKGQRQCGRGICHTCTGH